MMPIVTGRDCKLTIDSVSEPVKLRWVCQRCDASATFELPQGHAVDSVCTICGAPRQLYRPYRVPG